VDPPNVTVSRKDATLGAGLGYRFHRANWQPYVSGGLGVHFVSSKVNAPQLGLDDQQDSYIRGGPYALVGVSFPLTGHVQNFLELEYHHLPDASQLKINTGIGWGP
jgi:hypothetical protein